MTEGVTTEEQRWSFGGKPLNERKTLSAYNVQNESTLHVCLRLRGGVLMQVKIV